MLPTNAENWGWLKTNNQDWGEDCVTINEDIMTAAEVNLVWGKLLLNIGNQNQRALYRDRFFK